MIIVRFKRPSGTGRKLPSRVLKKSLQFHSMFG